MIKLLQYHSGWSADDVGNIACHRFWIGMEREQLLVSLGRPRDINRTVSGTGVFEQWIYGDWEYGHVTCIYVENGVVTSYQN